MKVDDEIFDSLPDDPELAFVHLENHYKSEMETAIENSNESQVVIYHKTRYMHQVIAVATSLDIVAIKEYTIPSKQDNIWEFYEKFSLAVLNLTIQIRIAHAKRRKKYSVSFSSAEKQKIRHYLNQIKELIDESNCPIEKREAILKRLNDLAEEVDKDRTKLEKIADNLRYLARLSGDVERDGAEPWWKWVKLIFGIVDDAKEKENENSGTLPKPNERKKIEAPKTEIDGPEAERDLDDEVPF
jgi:hypothetical protein